MTRDTQSSTRKKTAALAGLAAGGSIVIWSVASHVPNEGICAAMLPIPRACDTELRQQWALFWILCLAAVCTLGALSLRQRWLRDHRVALTAFVAEGVVIALACLAVRP